jgi:hypothetical protein
MSKNQKLANPAGPDDDIDLGAALPTAPAPKRGRGRPALPGGPAPKPRNPDRKVRKDKGIKKPKTLAAYIDNNILIGDDIIRGSDLKKINDIAVGDQGELATASDLKSKMTAKELDFIRFFFSGDYSKKDSMKLAGYEAAQDSYLYLLAKKILEKYESQAGDHRVIARALGAGEVFVISGLMDLAKNGKSEIVKRAALGDLAKILGLTKEQLEGAQGITIIFEGVDQPGPAALAYEPSEAQPALPAQRVLQITK